MRQIKPNDQQQNFGCGGLRKLTTLTVLMTAGIFAVACEQDDRVSCDGDPTDIKRPSFWTVETHCRGVEPDYDTVFDDSIVHRFDIAVSAANYKAMEDDMFALVADDMPTDLDELRSPILVPVVVKYDGNKWDNVAMRYKGHSSLIGAWNEPIRKMSFILDFDGFEEAVPSTVNQRFYGFKQLIFANGYTDQSFIREKVATQVFQDAGFPVPANAFAQVWVDVDDGNGPTYFGLYTFMEDPSDKMLEDYYGIYNDGLVGNFYKPHGDAARWRDPDEVVDGGVDDWWELDIETNFEKSNNEDISDWEDVMTVIRKLHKNRNVPEQWRAELEEVFDVQSFINYLAVGRVMMNWDSYGCMHHNYYLYANPFDLGRITWIPWDFGETMRYRQDAACPDLNGVWYNEIVYPTADSGIDTYWPLIQYILADTEYAADYRAAIQKVVSGPFAANKVNALINKYHNLVAPYIVGPKATEAWPYTTCNLGSNCSEFLTSVTDLQNHVAARHAAVTTALQSK